MNSGGGFGPERNRSKRLFGIFMVRAVPGNAIRGGTGAFLKSAFRMRNELRTPIIHDSTIPCSVSEAWGKLLSRNERPTTLYPIPALELSF